MDYLKYLRKDKMPHIWCDGCGNGIILKSILRTVDKLGWDKNKIALVSGIGCSGRTPGYVDFNTLHTTHGRALSFSTGIKLAKPEMHVIVVSGDGDATAIGGNHFIHAARRNIDLNLVVFNNYIYGMTGGQASPTTPTCKYASTTPYGNPDSPFDISELAKAAGASYVARTTTYHTAKMDRYMEQGFRKEGFSVIEVLTMCPTSYGRANKETGVTGAEMLKYQKKNSVSIEKAREMEDADLQDKFITGVYVDREKASYLDNYQEVRDKSN
jgi:2-oxoglutarate ferredoxin oxidoreductase subunit beta